MLTERCLNSATLGKTARDFISWSAAAGNDLSRMRAMSLAKAHAFAAESPRFQSFPKERIAILHPRDTDHYPAIRIARTRYGTETHIQSFNLITGAKQRYASILQSEKSGDAVSVTITRHLPLEPDGIGITFGKRVETPNYVGNHGAMAITIDLSGRVCAVVPEPWEKQAIIGWITSTLRHVTHGVSIGRMDCAEELSRFGYLNADPGHAGNLSAAFPTHPTLLE